MLTLVIIGHHDKATAAVALFAFKSRRQLNGLVVGLANANETASTGYRGVFTLEPFC